MRACLARQLASLDHPPRTALLRPQGSLSSHLQRLLAIQRNVVPMLDRQPQFVQVKLAIFVSVDGIQRRCRRARLCFGIAPVHAQPMRRAPQQVTLCSVKEIRDLENERAKAERRGVQPTAVNIPRLSVSNRNAVACTDGNILAGVAWAQQQQQQHHHDEIAFFA